MIQIKKGDYTKSQLREWAASQYELAHHCGYEIRNLEQKAFDYMLKDTTADKVLDQIKVLQPSCQNIFLDGWNMALEGKIHFECDAVIEKPFLLNDLLFKINDLMIR